MDTNRILAELRTERDYIERAIAAIEGLNSTGPRRGRRPGAVTAPKRARRSAAARARMAAAQRARWAKVRQTRASKPARRMSKAARRKIAAAQRARWAKVKSQQEAHKKVA